MKSILVISVLLGALAGCATFDRATTKPGDSVSKAISDVQPYLAYCSLLPKGDAVKACEDVREAARRLQAVLAAAKPAVSDSDAGAE